MTNIWIQRDITKIIQENTDTIQIIRGPRQCGKSSLILHLDPEFKELSLDDPALRELAQNDPEIFLRQFDSQKLFIDEAQYAPALFPSLKRKADLYKRNSKNSSQTILRLTGSNQILMDRNIKESLAVLAAGIQKSREFLKFVRLLAGRVGGILDLSDKYIIGDLEKGKKLIFSFRKILINLFLLKLRSVL